MGASLGVCVLHMKQICPSIYVQHDSRPREKKICWIQRGKQDGTTKNEKSSDQRRGRQPYWVSNGPSLCRSRSIAAWSTYLSPAHNILLLTTAATATALVPMFLGTLNEEKSIGNRETGRHDKKEDPSDQRRGRATMLGSEWTFCRSRRSIAAWFTYDRARMTCALLLLTTGSVRTPPSPSIWCPTQPKIRVL